MNSQLLFDISAIKIVIKMYGEKQGKQTQLEDILNVLKVISQ